MIALSAWQFIWGDRQLPRSDVLLPLSIGAGLLIAVTGFGLVVALAPRESAEEDFILYTLIYWLAFPAVAAMLVWLGAVLENSWWSNAGLILIGVFVLTRYFDLFAEAGQRGLVFVGSGVLLLVIAFLLERSRRLIETASEAPG